MIVVWLFLAVPWVCLQFVIVVFPKYTHLLFINLTLIRLLNFSVCKSYSVLLVYFYSFVMLIFIEID